MPSRTLGRFRSVVAAVDLSGRSERIVARARLLPWEEGGRLTLLHAAPRLLPKPLRARAEAHAKSVLDALARRAARGIPAEVEIQTRIEVGSPDAATSEAAKSTRAELIVVGRGGGGRIRDLFIGSTAERVARLSAVPVLLVRLPARGPYQRPVLALDRDDAADPSTRAALRMLEPPRPPITLVHACVAPFEGAIYSNLSRREVQQYRWHWRRQATLQAAELLTRARALARGRRR